jgi:hypothetical protein
MLPQKQTIETDFVTGVQGNCMATCVACLLDMPVSKVPNFIQYKSNTFNYLGRFLGEKGYNFNGFWYNPPIDWNKKFKGVDGYAIIGGPSPRPFVSSHAVIYKNGLPYFDPHPDDTFVLGITRIYLITKK